MNPNHYIQKLGHKYKLDVPTATRVWKIGFTATVEVCSATEATLLATHNYGQYSTNTAKILSGHNRKAAFSHFKPAA